MISRLRGKPVARRPDGLVLDVNGVGYLVAATPGVLRRAEGAEEVVVETYLVVREDALALYGFADASERELFEHLISVSGVGPKMALAIVSGSTATELRRAIALEDTARFEAIPGIGKKTASVLLLFCFNHPLMPVDRHVERVAKRIGLVPVKAHPDLATDQFNAMLAAAPERTYEAHVLLIHHGRAICQARSPKHDLCPIRDRCRFVDPKAP